MLTFYDLKNGVLSRRTEPATIADTTVWIDLLSPTAEEEAAIEKALNLDVPTPAEMREIETSNRFYAENGAQYMTTSIMYGPDSEQLASTNITFILTGQRLITVRYTEPRSIQMYAERACRAGDTPCTTGAHVLVGLIETIIQRQADLIERAQDAVERFAPQIFATKSTGATRGRRLDVVLRSIGREGDVTSRMQDSITSLLRTMHYFEDAARERKEDARLLGRIDVASRDLGALSDSLKAVANRITFLLDATLGMIS
ncbi:MAG: CorA family divalent cation transporter, partial [Hyphomicrobium sp.]